MHNMRKGFTLIEMLVVTGIIAVITIMALFFANFQESQKRSRDTVRVQDLAKLGGVMEAYMGDRGLMNVPGGSVRSIDQASFTGRRSMPCNNSWLPDDLCQYIKQVPADPRNGISVTTVNHPSASVQHTGTVGAYTFAINSASGDYEFCTRLEAEKNRWLLNDNGNSPDIFEAGSNTQAVTCPAP